MHMFSFVLNINIIPITKFVVFLFFSKMHVCMTARYASASACVHAGMRAFVCVRVRVCVCVCVCKRV